MKRRRNLLLLFFLLSFGLSLCISQDRAVAEEQSAAVPDYQELFNVVQELKQEFKLMRADYESRIQYLEEQLAAVTEKRPESPVHRAAPIGSYGGIMNPDVSIVTDIQAYMTTDDARDEGNRIRVKHAELAFRGYLYPGVRGDLIAALEQHYEGDSVETNVDLEEAFVSFLNLPYGIQAELGRMLMDFGRANPVHSHHWAFASSPLPLANFFGEHSWYDDGVQMSILVPNPWDLYLKGSFGVFNGRSLEHHHGDGHHHEHGHFHPEPIDWHNHIYTARGSLDLPLGDFANSLFGYSMAIDKDRNTALYGIDATFKYTWPGTFRRLVWQNEAFLADVEDVDNHPFGFYSMLKLALDKYWEVGTRYDWSEFANNDTLYEQAASLFITRYLTHSTYLRGEYRYRDIIHADKEHAFYIQFVWGLGPHSHRLED